jgi:hypothetical protein
VRIGSLGCIISGIFEHGEVVKGVVIGRWCDTEARRRIARQRSRRCRTANLGIYYSHVLSSDLTLSIEYGPRKAGSVLIG